MAHQTREGRGAVHGPLIIAPHRPFAEHTAPHLRRIEGVQGRQTVGGIRFADPVILTGGAVSGFAKQPFDLRTAQPRVGEPAARQRAYPGIVGRIDLAVDAPRILRQRTDVGLALPAPVDRVFALHAGIDPAAGQHVVARISMPVTRRKIVVQMVELVAGIRREEVRSRTLRSVAVT